MTALATILVATDLSPHADVALARAGQLAAEHGAALVVVHVFEPLRPADAPVPAWPVAELPAGFERDLETEAREELGRRLTGLPDAARSRARVELAHGVPFAEINRAARDCAADLVVLGAHGRRFLRDLLLGTTTERVIRKGDRPVLVVKRPGDNYRQVMVAVDYSAPARRALELAMRIAPAARLELLHAYEIWYEGKLRTGGMNEDDIATHRRRFEIGARGALAAFARDGGVDPAKLELAVQHGYPGTAVTAAADQRADLVAIGTRGLSGLHYVLLGSVAEHVLRESRCDVLVTRDPAGGAPP